METRNNLKPYLGGVVFSFMVGFSFLGIKTCIPYASTLQILTHRYNFALLAVVVMILFHIGKIKIKGKPKKSLIITGGFYVLFMIFQTIGLIFSSTIESAILFAIIPILVQIIASIWIKEKATIVQNLFVVISVFALVFMIIKGSTDTSFSLVGIVLLLIGSICMAINNVMMRYVRDKYTPFEITATIVILGFILFNLATVTHGIYTGTLGKYFEPFAHVEFIIATAYLGICCILFSALLMAYMQANMLSANASIFGNISTAISIVAGAVILGETLTIYHIICSIIIVGGVVGISLGGRKPKLGEKNIKS